MSVDQVKAFMVKVKDDAELAQKLADAKAAYKGTKEDGFKDVVIPVAAAAGFTFTVEEAKTYFEKTQGEGEASEDELEAVAGGSVAEYVCSKPAGFIGDFVCGMAFLA